MNKKVVVLTVMVCGKILQAAEVPVGFVNRPAPSTAVVFTGVTPPEGELDKWRDKLIFIGDDQLNVCDEREDDKNITLPSVEQW